jgi:polysaccharide biosynthesis/export protein
MSYGLFRMPRRLIMVLAFALCGVLQGCVIPRSGPLLSEVQASRDRNDIELVSVTPALALASRATGSASFPADFVRALPIDYEKLAPGDGVDISLWGQDGVGVFSSGAGGTGGMTDMGEMVIDEAGTIYVPQVGRVHAQGLTPAGLREAVERRLSRVTVGLDVNVRRTDRRGQTVTIEGDLSKPGVYPIGPGTQRLSGVLSQAAPNQTNPEQLAITVRRHGESASVRLSDIYRNSAEDIALRAGDSIVVHDVVENLTILGAAGAQSRVKLSKRNYTVLDALGDSRGLSDSLANPKAVFLLRIRPEVRPDVAASMMDTPPVIYQFDFTKPEQMVLAGKFSVQDGDAIYISDAPFTQVQKVLSAFSATLGTARSVSSLSQ